MIRRIVLLVLVHVLAVFGLHALAQEGEPYQPNILVIISDDQGVVDSPEYHYDPKPAPHAEPVGARERRRDLRERLGHSHVLYDACRLSDRPARNTQRSPDGRRFHPPGGSDDI